MLGGIRMDISYMGSSNSKAKINFTLPSTGLDIVVALLVDHIKELRADIIDARTEGDVSEIMVLLSSEIHSLSILDELEMSTNHQFVPIDFYTGNTLLARSTDGNNQITYTVVDELTGIETHTWTTHPLLHNLIFWYTRANRDMPW